MSSHWLGEGLFWHMKFDDFSAGGMVFSCCGLYHHAMTGDDDFFAGGVSAEYVKDSGFYGQGILPWFWGLGGVFSVVLFVFSEGFFGGLVCFVAVGFIGKPFV